MTEKKNELTIEVFEGSQPAPTSVRSHLGYHLVSLLEECGGDVEKLCTLFSENSPYVLFYIERELSKHIDSSLRERWEQALDQFHTSKMRLIQRKAIKVLENLDKVDEKQARVDLAFAKLALNDLFTASATSAKMKAASQTNRSSDLDNIQAELEED
jgi:hypothetical protein